MVLVEILASRCVALRAVLVVWGAVLLEHDNKQIVARGIKKMYFNEVFIVRRSTIVPVSYKGL